MSNSVFYILCPVLTPPPPQKIQCKVASQKWLNQHDQEKQGMSSIHMPVSALTFTPNMQISPAMPPRSVDGTTQKGQD